MPDKPVQASEPVRYQFGELAGRWDQAATAIERNWKQNTTEGILEYPAEFIASCFDYPQIDPELSRAVYAGGTMEGFVMTMPRFIRLDGRDLRLLLPTIFNVSPEAKGVGAALWAETLKRGRSAGWDGVINFCVDGNKANTVTTAIATRLGYLPKEIFTVQFLMRPLMPDSRATPKELEEDFLVPFSRHAKKLLDRVRFCRTWTDKEIQWELRRYGAVYTSFCGQPDRGLITGFIQNIADQESTPCVFFENIFWDGLQLPERKILLDAFSSAAAARGARIAIVPILGYTDLEAFRAARFRASTRRMHLYLTLLDRGPGPGPLPSIYTDVF